MPLALQKKVVASIIGRRKAGSWGDILTEWPYPCRERPDGVKYRTGQPMGAYSSWNVMALTHHYIVRLAALRSGFPDFKEYALLGDDIVIANSAVADRYRELLRTLDMPISEHKTHTSKIVYEFAKRWVYQGVEVTPYSVGGLIKCYNKYPYLHNFLETQGNHGWNLPIDRHPELVRTIYKIMGKPQQGVRSLKLYMIFEALSKMKKVGVFNSTAYKALEQYFGFPSLSEDEATLLTERIIREARLRMLQTDMKSVQEGTLYGINLIGDRLKEQFPGLDAPKYRQLSRTHTPLGIACGDRENALVDLVCLIYDPDTPVSRLLDVEGMNKYALSKGTFSNVREHRAVLLAFSRLVKAYINDVKSEIRALTLA